jgi:hypothetical protein
MRDDLEVCNVLLDGDRNQVWFTTKDELLISQIAMLEADRNTLIYPVVKVLQKILSIVSTGLLISVKPRNDVSRSLDKVSRRTWQVFLALKLAEFTKRHNCLSQDTKVV